MSLETYKTQGNEMFKAKRYDEAIAAYTKAVNCDPNSEAAAAVYSNRAASYSALNRQIEALQDADNCIRVKPAWLKGHFRKGAALESLGRLDEAVRAFDDALKTEPQNEEVQDRLNSIRKLVKERNDRMKPQMCKTAEEAKIIGNSHFGLGQYETASLFYTRAIDLTSQPSEEKANYHANRAACRQQIHDFKGVVEDANFALEMNPNHVKALHRRAIAWEGLEKWQNALEDYQKVNQLAPGMSNVSQGVMRCQRALRG